MIAECEGWKRKYHTAQAQLNSSKISSTAQATSVQSAPNFYNINVTQEHSVSKNTLGEMTHDINTIRADMLKQTDFDQLKDDILQTVERRMSQRSEREVVSSANPEGGELEMPEEMFDCSLDQMLERTS